MSKSKGNVVAPQTVMNALGADVLRLWVASTDYRGEMNVSDEILNRTADAYRRLRNTARFLLSNLEGFDPARHQVAAADMLALDRWVVDRAYSLQEEIVAAYATYQLQTISQKVLHFCSLDLGGFYLDIIKDRQYTAKTDGLARRSVQTAMYHVVEALCRWLAPIISFTADEIWQAIPGQRSESVFLATWYSELSGLPADAVLGRDFWKQLMDVRPQVSKVIEQHRAKGEIGASLTAEVQLYCDAEYFSLLKAIEKELHFIFITSGVALFELAQAPADAVATEIAGIKVKVTAATHTKCGRCWHQRADVGANVEHPELCGRCVENVVGNGEVRLYA